MHGPFAELALLLFIAAVVGALGMRLRQPMLIAYIVVGIAVGPAGLGHYGEHLLARLKQNGIAAMGVDFDPETVRRLRHHGFSVRFGDGDRDR